MELYSYALGELESNCYILVNEKTREAIAIDIGGDEKFLYLSSIKNNFEIKYVLLTHGHFDHIGGVKFFKDKGAKVYIGLQDGEMTLSNELNFADRFGFTCQNFEADILLKGGDTLSLCDIDIKVISTPGHSKGGVCYLIGDKLFTGDTLMRDCYGRYDGYGGSYEQLMKSLVKIFEMDENLNVYPGHGEKTTIKEEKCKYVLN